MGKQTAETEQGRGGARKELERLKEEYLRGIRMSGEERKKEQGWELEQLERRKEYTGDLWKDMLKLVEKSERRLTEERKRMKELIEDLADHKG